MADSLKREMVASSDSFITPHLLDVEAASALRSMVAGRRFDSHRAEEFLAGLAALPAERYSHTPLLGRCGLHSFGGSDQRRSIHLR